MLEGSRTGGSRTGGSRTGWPRAGEEPSATALLRTCPEDFRVSEALGFEPSGDGEHVFLQLEKRNLNTVDLVHRVASLSGTPERDIGYSGLKDRNAVTRQWLSIRMAGRVEPAWSELERGGDIRLLQTARHRRKLRRGVHRANDFSIRLREVTGDRGALEQRLCEVQREGVPNYFGEQRFGRGGSTLEQARHWVAGGARRVTRTRRSLYLSALRAWLFNSLLASRVKAGSWNSIVAGDVCVLQGTRSHFHCESPDEDIRQRARRGDLHPALPLWGRGASCPALKRAATELASVGGALEVCEFLEGAGLEVAWRPARALADDFCWQFCDDDGLQLDFALGAGSYATAVLAEFIRYHDASGNNKEKGSEGD